MKCLNINKILISTREASIFDANTYKFEAEMLNDSNVSFEQEVEIEVFYNKRGLGKKVKSVKKLLAAKPNEKIFIDSGEVTILELSEKEKQCMT